MNDVAAKHSGKSASQVPISKHPAFPAIVALWFAALLGIGSLVLPVSLFEAAIAASGIAGVLPAAEPPLGVSARILIALVGAAVGVIAGLVIARKVAGAQGRATPAPRKTPLAADDTPFAKRPISAHEELWSEGFDEPVEDARAAPIPGRRRALAVTDESGPSAFLDRAQLPGDEVEIVLEQAPSAPQPADAPLAAAGEDDTLELAAFAESEAIETFAEAQPATLEPAAEADDFEEPAPEPVTPESTLDAVRPFDAPPAAPAPFTAAEGPNEHLHGEVPVEQDAAVTAPFAPFAEPDAEAHVAADLEDASAEQEDDAQGPVLSELSITELVERFTLSLQHAAERAEAEAQTEAAAEAEARTIAAEAELPPRYVPDLGVEAVEAPRFASPAESEMAAIDEAAEEPVLELADEPASHVPAALRPGAFDEECDEDEDGEEFPLTLSFAPESRPFDRPSATPAPVAASAAQSVADETDEAGDDQGKLADQGYSSLLDMRKQVSSREFVRIEDEAPAVDAADDAIEPIVVFPGQEQRRAAPPADAAPADHPSIGRVTNGAAPDIAPVERPFAAPASLGRGTDPMQTERALRDALQKLQRLSGAA